MASRCDEQEAADDLRKLEAATSESADVLIAVVKDLQTKSLWISVAVAGTNPYRFMLIFVRSCFRLPLLLLDLLVRVLLQGVFHTFHTCMLCPHIYIYYMHDKKSCGILLLQNRHTTRVPTGRASCLSLSSDASASTFEGRRDAVYGARRSVSGSSRKACELCVTLLDLCLFGLKFAAQAQPKMSMNVYSNSIWCIHFLMFACLVVVQTQLQDVNEALVHVAL